MNSLTLDRQTSRSTLIASPLGILAVYLVACGAVVGAKISSLETFASNRTQMGTMQVTFVANRGQIADEVDFFVKGQSRSVFFTSRGLTFCLDGPDEERSRLASTHPHGEASTWAVKMDFLGANPVRPVGLDRREATFNYFTGPSAQWRTAVPSYARLLYRDLWPGVHLTCRGDRSALKYEFELGPGTDPGVVRMLYRGGDVTLTPAGELRIATPLGTITDAAPKAWQTIGGKTVDVSCRFDLEERPNGETEVRFALGEYDRSSPLIIDPEILIYCGFLGGQGVDEGRGIAVDSLGNAYVTGWTTSTQTSFPETAGPGVNFRGVRDAFVAKVAADGTQLLYCGYIGGTRDDSAWAIAVDNSGNAYISGDTDSYPNSFPVVAGPDLTRNSGDNGFVAKVSADGTQLLYAGYLAAEARGIAVDLNGHAYVTGSAGDSTNFTTTVGPDLTHNGGRDAFAAKIAPDGSSLVYAGYIGGAQNDEGTGIAVDPDGNAYVCGETSSQPDTFPDAVGPSLTFARAFVAKVNSDGLGLGYCGYVGGTPDGIAVDSSGSAFIAGYEILEDHPDAFVKKVESSGAAFDFQRYVGGSRDDRGHAIALDAQGSIYLAGTASSRPEDGFPIVGGPSDAFNGIGDGFVTKIDPTGASLVYSGYLGGASHDHINGITVDGDGFAYVVGTTSSLPSTFPETVGPDLTSNGGDDAFVAKLLHSYPLGVPKGLRAAIHSANAIRLVWDSEPAEILRVDIERRAGEGSFLLIGQAVPGDKSFLDGGVTIGTTYTYRIRVVAGTTEGPYSNEASVHLGQPAAPSGLIAQGWHTGGIHLRWNDNSSNETLFQVQRRTEGGSFVPLVDLAANRAQYMDNSAAPDVRYFYRVVAWNPIGTGPSGEDAATRLAPPTNFLAAADGWQINIDWVDESDRESEYRLYRSDTGFGALRLIAILPANATHYSETVSEQPPPPASPTQYHYELRAFSSEGDVSLLQRSTAETLRPPTNVRARALDSTWIRLLWVGEYGAIIERRRDEDPPVTVNTGSNSQFDDYTVSHEHRFTYVVRLVRGANRSHAVESNPSFALTPPSSVQAAALDQNRIQVTWEDNSVVEGGYRVFRRQGAGSWVAAGDVGADAESFTDVGLSPGTHYTYRVLTMKNDDRSSYTPTVNATTLP